MSRRIGTLGVRLAVILIAVLAGIGWGRAEEATMRIVAHPRLVRIVVLAATAPAATLEVEGPVARLRFVQPLRLTVPPVPAAAVGRLVAAELREGGRQLALALGPGVAARRAESGPDRLAIDLVATPGPASAPGSDPPTSNPGGPEPAAWPAGAPPASDRGLRVRTGRHPTHLRVVLEGPRARELTVRTAPPGLELVGPADLLPEVARGLEAAAPAVVRATVDGGRLVVELAADISVLPRAGRHDQIVLDLRPQPSGQVAAPGRPPPTSQPAAAAVGRARGSGPGPAEEAGSPLPPGCGEDRLCVLAEPTPEGGALRLALAPRPALAVLVRAATAWVVLDRLVDSVELGEASPAAVAPLVRSLTREAHPEATLLRVELGEGATVRAVPVAEGWRLELRRGPAPAPPEEVTPRRLTDPTALAIPAGGRIVRLPAHLLGSEVAVLPTAAGSPRTAARELVDLEFLPTVHGLAWRPIADDLRANASEGATVIGRPGGLRLDTAPLPAGPTTGSSTEVEGRGTAAPAPVVVAAAVPTPPGPAPAHPDHAAAPVREATGDPRPPLGVPAGSPARAAPSRAHPTTDPPAVSAVPGQPRLPLGAAAGSQPSPDPRDTDPTPDPADVRASLDHPRPPVGSPTGSPAPGDPSRADRAPDLPAVSESSGQPRPSAGAPSGSPRGEEPRLARPIEDPPAVADRSAEPRPPGGAAGVPPAPHPATLSAGARAGVSPAEPAEPLIGLARARPAGPTDGVLKAAGAGAGPTGPAPGRGTAGDRRRAREELARGRAAEALALLGEPAAAFDPTAEPPADAATRALAGVAAALLERPVAAARLLDDPRLASDPEVALWRGLVAGQRRDWQAAGQALAASGRTFQGYPPLLQRRLAPLLARIQVEIGRTTAAYAAVDTARRSGPDPRETARLQLVEGLGHERDGAFEEAAAAFRRAAEGADRTAAIEARYRLARLELERGRTGPAETVAELARQRLHWRDHPAEPEMLEGLALALAAAGRTAEALETGRELAARHPEAPRADAVARHARTLLAAALAGTDPGATDPITALRLLRRFPDQLADADTAPLLTLARRLAAVGLPGTAAGLLAERVVPELGGSERALAALEAAELRLAAGEPSAALELLRAEAGTPVLPPEAAARARALRAAAEARGGDGRAAEDLAAQAEGFEAAWRSRDWPRVAELGRRLLAAGQPPAPGREPPELRLRSALALAAMGDFGAARDLLDGADEPGEADRARRLVALLAEPASLRGDAAEVARALDGELALLRAGLVGSR